ncbi:MAG: acyl carrier protein [Firmicutes bacterium]|nr:acyl carrier protein [Bacillota bacterium]
MENEKEKKGNLEKVIAVVAKQLNKKPETIKAESRVVEDLAADSLDVVEMLMNLEETYGVAIPDEVAMKLKTVGQIAGYLDEVESKSKK